MSTPVTVSRSISVYFPAKWLQQCIAYHSKSCETRNLVPSSATCNDKFWAERLAALVCCICECAGTIFYMVVLMTLSISRCDVHEETNPWDTHYQFSIKNSSLKVE